MWYYQRYELLENSAICQFKVKFNKIPRNFKECEQFDLLLEKWIRAENIKLQIILMNEWMKLINNLKSSIKCGL